MHRLRALRRWQKILLVLLLLLGLAVLAFVIWASQVFPAEPIARDIAKKYSVTNHDSAIVIEPSSANGRGLVFIPGAKVDPVAYEYKLSGLVDAGYTVVITKPFLNLAFFDQRSLSTFTQYAPTVKQWLVGGHSLGGVRACQYASQPGVVGLVLFGSYCINDVSVPTISLRGSNDQLTTQHDVDNAKAKLKNARYVLVDGADHAAFGDYGVQPGDGEMTTRDELVKQAITDGVMSLKL